MPEFNEADIETITALQRGDRLSDQAPVAETATQDSNVVVNTSPTSIPSTASGSVSKNTPLPVEKPVETQQSSVDLSLLGFKTSEELTQRLQRLSELEKQNIELSEYKAGPRFKSERHRLLFDYGQRIEGMELSAARQLLEVVSLDLNNLPDQQMRFEAFKLQPENKNLSQDEMRALFTANELERFGNALDTENPPNEVQIIRAKQATAQAKESIAKLQTEWNAARTAERTPQQEAEERQRYNQSIQNQMASFDGIQSIKLSAIDEKGEKLEGAMNFKIDAQKQLPTVIQALQDPSGWWVGLLDKAQIMGPNRQHPDFHKFAELVSFIEYKDQYINNAYQQGLADAKVAQLKNARQVADPAAGGGVSQTSEVHKLSEKDSANLEAMKVAGLLKTQ